MSGDTEVLYTGEHFASQEFKITRICRHVRALRLDSQTPDAHIAIVGLLSSKLLLMTHAQMERERRWLKDTLWDVRETLIGMALPKQAIRVYVPFKVVPVEASVVALYALGTAPRAAGPYMWGREPRIQPAVTPQIEAALKMEYDEKAREEDLKRSDHAAVPCEIEISVWNSANKKVSVLSGFDVTLAVGPNGVKEVGGELTLLKGHIDRLDLRQKLASGAIQKIEIAVKGEVSVERDKHGAVNSWEARFKEWKAALKLSLSADLRIPFTQIRLPVEIEASVDHEGKREFLLKITVHDW